MNKITLMDRDGIVTLRTFSNEAEALIVKGLLDSAGINSSLIHEDVTGLLPMLGGQTGIELAVAAEDAKRPQELLAAKFDENELIGR
jgi:hypothetical protein